VTLCPLPPRLPERLAARAQREALAPFPAPRELAGPWHLNRAPLTPAAYIGNAARLARRHDALTLPPRAPGVANVSLNRNKEITGPNHITDRESVIIPGPVHLDTITSTLIIGGTTRGAAWIEIPELGYRREIDREVSVGTEQNMLTTLDIDVLQPVTLVAAYEGLNPSVGVQTFLALAAASLSYRPITS